jgi:redox-sensitive bicupin YhaK (pirin superfamily)
VGVLARGDVQAMTAGRGVSHSEKNRSKTEPLRLIQVWIRPSERGLEPAYAERSFPENTRRNVWRAVASGDARYGSLRIHQDAAVYATALSAGKELRHALGAGRSAWVQVVRGEGTLNGRRLGEGDGAAATEEKELAFVAGKDVVEALLFDLP